MTTKKQQAVSFDEIIQATRLRKKHEELAAQLLGKNRHVTKSKISKPGSDAGLRSRAKGQQPVASNSLAQRIGVDKRTVSAPSKAGFQSTQTRQTQQNRPREKTDRLAAALDPRSGQANVRDYSRGLAIKGASSTTFVVVGSNFAPGTTAADIQSALEPVVGQMRSCWITAQHPTVTAEMEFDDQSTAEILVANFHNKRADGRILTMHLKSSPSGGLTTASAQASRSTASRLREAADRDKRLARRAEPEVQDGSYGFSEQSYQALTRNNEPATRAAISGASRSRPDNQKTGLYSDVMIVDEVPPVSRNRSGRRY